MSSSTDEDNDIELYGSNVRYYKMLLENNYISDLSKTNFSTFLQMEHSYSRDWRPMEGAHVMTTRSILVHRPPPCPSCHVHSHDDIGLDIGDTYNPPLPTYNEEAAKMAMEECERAASQVRTTHGDDADWEQNVNRLGWSKQQITMFDSMTNILDLDHLGRLANRDRLHEPVLRRCVIDKSVARVRKTMAKVAWDIRLTQWIHNLLMDSLPVSYMASYLDILQTLKTKVPEMVDKMMYGRPISGNPDLLGSVLKKAWEPCVAHKVIVGSVENRKLPGQAVIVIVPSAPVISAPTSRMQRWYSLLATMANVVPIQMNLSGGQMDHLPLSSVTEQMIAVSRAKLHEIRLEAPSRQIVLVGFNAGAAIALQVALVETVNSVVCMGFAYNTLNGVRGAPDDRILDITTPVLFVLGQNSARSSQEEIESLREKMQAQTSLVVVGSADDALRVSKTKRQIESVTQTMVDNMIMDEISEFTSTCIINPPAPRDLVAEKVSNGSSRTSGTLPTATAKKRKINHAVDEHTPKTKMPRNADSQDGQHKNAGHPPRKVGRPRIHPTPAKPLPKPSLLTPPSDEVLDMAIQSIMPAATEPLVIPVAKDPIEIISTYEVMPNMDLRPITAAAPKPRPSTTHMPRSLTKMKLLPPNQFVKIKPPTVNQKSIYALHEPTKLVQSPPTYTVRTQMKPIATGGMTTMAGNAINISATGVDGKVFTLKSSPTGTQMLSASASAGTVMAKKSIVTTTKASMQKSASGSVMISPQKFTIMKSHVGGATAHQPHPTLMKMTSATTNTVTKPSPDFSGTNIFDIPIVFADNDGNISDNSNAVATSAPPTPLPQLHASITLPGSSTPIHMSSNPIQNRNIIINSIGPNKPNPNNKVLVFNRGSLKGQSIQVTNPMTNVTIAAVASSAGGNSASISATTTTTTSSSSSSTTTMNNVPGLIKYTKVNVSNASSISMPMRTNTVANIGMIRPMQQPVQFKPSSFTVGSKVELLHNSIIKASSPIITTLGNRVEVLNSSLIKAATSPLASGKFQPIVINVDSDKTTIKNMIKVGDGQMKTNTILIKPGGLKPIPMMKPGILNRNLTVRKVVNIVQQKPTTVSVMNATTAAAPTTHLVE